MRKLALASLLCLALGVAWRVAIAGERIMGAGCNVVVIDAGVASSALNAACVWGDGDKLTFQCDGGVFYSKDGTSPTAGYPYVPAGDPYPFTALRSSSVNPLKVQTYNGATNVTCNVFISDRN